MPVKSHRIANTHRENLEPRAVRVHPVDNCVPRVGLANIARRSDRYIEHAVRTEGDKFPPMVFLMRKLVVDDYWLRRTLQVRLDVVIARYARYFGHIERAVPNGNAIRHVQPACDLDYFVGSVVFIAVDYSVDISGVH